MFRLFVCQQLKTLKFTNVSSARHSSINFKELHSAIGDDSVNNSIDKLRIQVEQKSKISDNLIGNISKGLKGCKLDIHQSLNLLRNCAKGKFHNDPSPFVNEIWHQIKKQNAPTIQHYVAAMQLFQKWRNSSDLQAIFDEMVEAKVEPNP